MNKDTVRVAVRIRPLVETELQKGCQSCVDVVPGEPQIIINNTDKTFTFNYVFPTEVDQEKFYDTAVKDIVQNIFQGYNVTILAYGQTGTGKTYSMGTNYNETEDTGVIPRAVHDIFNIMSSKENYSFKVTVSFMELYQEQLYDLLADKQRSQSIVEIRDDRKSLKIAGVVEKEVVTAAEALRYLMQGSTGRSTGATAMNAHSSRSHAIFTLYINQQKKDDPNTATVAKFHLVDLAGSERSKKTQAIGDRFKEGVNINKGLLALGNVISQLGEGGSTSFVNYRDSKLTRLLQDSLGGNSVTLMIACISPADYNLDETLSTLRYADRARKIKNKPVVNQDPNTAKINQLNKLVQELKLALVDREIKTSCPLEHQELESKNQSLQNKIRELTQNFNKHLIETLVMHENLELAEQARDKIKADMAKILEECQELLNKFNKDPSLNTQYREHLEALYLKILAIQKDEKKTSEELINYEIASDQNSGNDDYEDSLLTKSEFVPCTEADNLEEFDEKQEQHNILQIKRNNEVQNINKALAIKENLMHELLKNSSQMIDYDHVKEIQDMEQEIHKLQTEKEELLQTLQNVQTKNVSSKLAESRCQKVQGLEKKIAELNRKISEQDQIVKTKEKQDRQIKNLSNEMQFLKQTRVKLIRQMRNDSDKFAKWINSKEKELNRLKMQNRKQVNEVTRLKTWYSKQETVFRRKMEEAFAVNKRLKDALDLQKQAKLRKEKINNNSDKMQSWLNQELQVLVSTIDAECSLEKLMQERASLMSMMDEIKNSGNANEEKIAEISDFLNLRNAQITDLQQKIVESDQENKAQTRLKRIHTMEDGKTALKMLFEYAAAERRMQRTKWFEYNELLERYELLEAQFTEYKTVEKKKRVSQQFTANTTNTITEFQNEISQLKEELELCKEQRHQMEKKDLNEIDDKNEIIKRKSKKKTKVTELLYKDYQFDDSITEIDDIDKDPDWKETPLQNRIRKLLNTRQKSTSNQPSLKRSSGGEIKCACKTKCNTRLCTCRKNKALCVNCNCNIEICQNRNAENGSPTLFSDQVEVEERTEN